MVLEDEGDDFTWAGNASTSSAQAIKNPTVRAGAKAALVAENRIVARKRLFIL